MPTAIEYLRALVAKAWRPLARAAADVWCENHVRLSDQVEASRGPYELGDRPWWREILKAATDPETRTLTIVASTQVGKTLALCALILYLAKNAPASALVAMPDKLAAIEFRDRLYALAKESGLRVPPQWRWNVRFCDIGPMRVYLAWSGSRQGLRGRRCKYVFLSEIDVYQPANRGGDPIEAAKQRVKAYPSHLIFCESSPIAEPSRIDKLLELTDQRRWWCECPKCGRWQVPRFFPHRDGEAAGRGGVIGIVDGDGNQVSVDAARVSARYLCVSGCVLGEDTKAQFMRAGMWLPASQSIDADGEVVGEAVRTQDVGFHLWAAHSNATWGTIAAEWIKAKRNGTVPEFFQNWLGASHKTRGAMPGWEELGRRLALVGHRRAIVPAEAWFLTGSCDVQEDEVYAAVRAWGDAKTSWLVDWWVFDREDDDQNDLVKSDLLQITGSVINGWFPVAGRNPRGRNRLQVALCGIDGKFRTNDVHEWIRSHGETPRIRAVQGDGSMRAGVRYKSNTVYEARRTKEDGTKQQYEGGLELWSINVNGYRKDLAERFKGSAKTLAGAWLLPEEIGTVGQHYLKQLVNEPPVLLRGKDGRPKLVFKERDSELGHDFWDVEVNQLCLADMLVDQLPDEPGWDASKWDRGERKSRKPAGERVPPGRSAR